MPRTVKIEDTKFLGNINSGVQAKLTFLESKIKQLGKQVKSDWKLASLVNNKQLYIEDTTSGDYYAADYRRAKGGKYIIDNIAKIEVVQGKKKNLFEQNCHALINALEENSQKDMANAFNRMASQKFTSHTIPLDGVVRTRDNITRQLNTKSDTILTEDVRRKIAKAFADILSDKVVIEDGRIISGSFKSGKIKLPITEWTCRKRIARQMRTVAENAYKSPAFQAQVYKIAKLVAKGSIEEAVALAKPFLAEHQEFTMLGKKQIQALVENALATKACFNQTLCEHTGLLLHRTNLKVNRDDIIDEWRNVAKKAGNSALLENVQILEESDDFEGSYSKFIDLVFTESMSSRDVQIDSYLNTLKSLKADLKAPDLKDKVTELIESLQGRDVDDATIAEVEDLLAGTQDELKARSDLKDFDAEPDIEDDLAEIDTAGMKQPINIEINAPLISIGGEKEEELGGLGDLGDEDLSDLGDEDLGAEEDLDEEEGDEDLDLGSLEDEGEELGDEDLDLGGLGESRHSKINVLFESFTRSGVISEGLMDKVKQIYGTVSADGKEAIKRRLEQIKELSEDEQIVAMEQIIARAKKFIAADKEKQINDAGSDLGESKKPWEKDEKKSKEDDDDSEIDEDDSMCEDVYGEISEDSIDLGLGLDYGHAPLVEADDVVDAMVTMAEERGLIDGQLDDDAIATLATEAFDSVGYKVPKGKMDAAISQVAEQFVERVKAIAENQYKGATKRRRMNPRRASINPTESRSRSGSVISEDLAEISRCLKALQDKYPEHSKFVRELRTCAMKKSRDSIIKAGEIFTHLGDLVDPDILADCRKAYDNLARASKAAYQESKKPTKIVWVESKDNNHLGRYKGVEFTLALDEPSVVFNETGDVELGIDDEIAKSARSNDNRQFVEWLNSNLGALTIGRSEDDLLDEAVAHITTNSDGSISIDVEGDVDVNEIDQDMDSETGTPDLGMGPVNEPPAPIGDEGSEMPDFENMGAEDDLGDEASEDMITPPENPNEEFDEESESEEESETEEKSDEDDEDDDESEE